MSTWYAEIPPDPPRIGRAGALRAGIRLAYLAPLVFGGLALLLAVRLVERPLWGAHRPWTPWITCGVCRGALWIMGLRRHVAGRMARGRVAMVSNHASWIDIFALNACGPLYFVSKAEVARWPGIGWLARATGTVFITRDRRDAARHLSLLTERLGMGHRLLIFPEGTSTDGRRVLPFKTTLFAPFLAQDMKVLEIQPVTLAYRAPAGAPPRFYGWWGDMSFGPHLIKALAAARPGRVTVAFHPPTRAAAHSDRKALARRCERVVRAGLERRLELGEPVDGVGGAPDLFTDGDEIGDLREG